MASNIEDFLLRFVFEDKNTVKKIKQLAENLDKIESNSKKNAKSEGRRAKERERRTNRRITLRKKFSKQHKESIKQQKKDEKDLQRMRDADSRKNLARVKQEQALQKKRTAQQENVKDKLARVERSVGFQNLMSGGSKQQEYAAKSFSKMQRALAENTRAGNREFLKQVSILNQVSREYNKAKRKGLGLATVQNGLADSTRNMIRSYASLFVLFEGTQGIANIGKQYQSLSASMLIASGSAEQAEKDLKFVRDTAKRLGVDLFTAAKGFQQLAIAGRGVITMQQTKDLFVATAEAGRALGLSMDDIKGTTRAFTQMLSKGNVQA